MPQKIPVINSLFWYSIHSTSQSELQYKISSVKAQQGSLKSHKFSLRKVPGASLRVTLAIQKGDRLELLPKMMIIIISPTLEFHLIRGWSKIHTIASVDQHFVLGVDFLFRRMPKENSREKICVLIWLYPVLDVIFFCSRMSNLRKQIDPWIVMLHVYKMFTNYCINTLAKKMKQENGCKQVFKANRLSPASE